MIAMKSWSKDQRDALKRAGLGNFAEVADGLPRRTLFYFYGGDLAKLSAAASAAGYQVKPRAANDGVIVEVPITIIDMIYGEILRMEEWAEEFGCDYDGWKCEVVTH
jgi:hypothetical protein